MGGGCRGGGARERHQNKIRDLSRGESNEERIVLINQNKDREEDPYRGRGGRETTRGTDPTESSSLAAAKGERRCWS